MIKTFLNHAVTHQNGTVYIENAMKTVHAQCVTAWVIIGEFSASVVGWNCRLKM